MYRVELYAAVRRSVYVEGLSAQAETPDTAKESPTGHRASARPYHVRSPSS